MQHALHPTRGDTGMPGGGTRVATSDDKTNNRTQRGFSHEDAMDEEL